MKGRPILFSAPMVRAILAGTKTQTRRVVKPQPAGEWAAPGRSQCPYGEPGDRLWVRETFRGPYAYEFRKYPLAEWGNKPVWYCADGNPPEKVERQFWPKCRPSIHMPRRFSRITLEITGVRVERLQGISEADARAEGAECLEVGGEDGVAMSDWSHREGFMKLWESLNGPGSWDDNPWVWVVEFRKAAGGKG